MTEPVKIAIIIEGGLLQNVMSAGVPVEYVLIDYDVCHDDADDVHDIPQDGGKTEKAICNISTAQIDGPGTLALFDIVAPPEVAEHDDTVTPMLAALEAVVRVIDTTDCEHPTFIDSGADSLDMLWQIAPDIHSAIALAKGQGRRCPEDGNLISEDGVCGFCGNSPEAFISAQPSSLAIITPDCLMEVACCVWEAILDIKSGPDVEASFSAIGTSAMRQKACDWAEMVESDYRSIGSDEGYIDPFDWGFVPEWLALNVDWTEGEPTLRTPRAIPTDKREA